MLLLLGGRRWGNRAKIPALALFVFDCVPRLTVSEGIRQEQSLYQCCLNVFPIFL